MYSHRNDAVRSELFFFLADQNVLAFGIAQAIPDIEHRDFARLLDDGRIVAGHDGEVGAGVGRGFAGDASDDEGFWRGAVEVVVTVLGVPFGGGFEGAADDDARVAKVLFFRFLVVFVGAVQGAFQGVRVFENGRAGLGGECLHGISDCGWV
ncbi:DUF1328 domain-containing protein [Stutzerimonas stutzeri]|nr:DUF1328 domain-containing protein [Stutzerimonas degradans]UVO17131.1 DUF1328 domain-containing protein [Stutzerimonas stutzeri]